MIVCNFGGEGECPADDSGLHFFVYGLEQGYDGRVCLDCGEREPEKPK